MSVKLQFLKKQQARQPALASFTRIHSGTGMRIRFLPVSYCIFTRRNSLMADGEQSPKITK